MKRRAAHHRRMAVLASARARAALDLAFPATCAGCGREGPPICARLPPGARRPARRCPAGVPIGLPADLPAPLLQLEWCAPFAGPVRGRAPRAQVRRRATARRAARRGGRAALGARSASAATSSSRSRSTRDRARAARLRPGRAHRRGRGDRAWACPSAPSLERRRATIAQFDLDRRDRARQRGRRVRGRRPLRPRPRVRGRWVAPRRRRRDDRRDAGGLRDRPRATPARSAVSAVTVARER